MSAGAPAKGPIDLQGGQVEPGRPRVDPESASWLQTADGEGKSPLAVRRARETPGPLPAFLGYQFPPPHPTPVGSRK